MSRWCGIASAGRFYLPNDKEYVCGYPDKVLIGTVVSRWSIQLPNGYLDSVILLHVERQLRGETDELIELRIGGGRIGTLLSTDSASPRMPLGSRHLLFLTTVGVPAPVISSHQRVDAEEALPPTPSLRAAFASWCGE